MKQTSRLCAAVFAVVCCASISCQYVAKTELVEQNSAVQMLSATPTPSQSQIILTTQDTGIVKLPRQVGFVNDFAGVLDNETKTQLEQTLKALSRKGRIDFAIVTVVTTGDLSAFNYSLALAGKWNLGAKQPDKSGLLLLVAVDDRKWHIQISRSLEKDLSNEIVASMGDETLRPSFSAGRYSEGIANCVDAFIKRLAERRSFTMGKD